VTLVKNKLLIVFVSVLALLSVGVFVQQTAIAFFDFAGYNFDVNVDETNAGKGLAFIDDEGFLVLQSSANTNGFQGRQVTKVSLVSEDVSDIVEVDEFILLYNASSARSGSSGSASFQINLKETNGDRFSVLIIEELSVTKSDKELGKSSKSLNVDFTKLRIKNNFDGTFFVEGQLEGQLFNKIKDVDASDWNGVSLEFFTSAVTPSHSGDRFSDSASAKLKVINIVSQRGGIAKCKVDEALLPNGSCAETDLNLFDPAAFRQETIELIEEIEARLEERQEALLEEQSKRTDAELEALLDEEIKRSDEKLEALLEEESERSSKELEEEIKRTNEELEALLDEQNKRTDAELEALQVEIEKTSFALEKLQLRQPDIIEVIVERDEAALIELIDNGELADAVDTDAREIFNLKQIVNRAIIIGSAILGIFMIVVVIFLLRKK